MTKKEFNKYSVVELCGLTNVSDKNVKACFITDEKDYNLFVMGNLRYNFLLERLTGKFGVKILQNCNVPIFIA